MTTRTHATTINWNSSGALGALAEPHQQLTSALGRMDGDKFWGYSLWRIPEGQVWRDNDMSPKEYLQCAGNADRMAVELRGLGPDGRLRQYAIGRPGTAHNGEPSIPVTWKGVDPVMVHPGEDFTAEQAASVFISYYETGHAPAGYVCRDLDLSAS